MERWKDVVGYEGLYQVSDLGRIQRLNRDGSVRRIIKAATHVVSGRNTVGLSKNGVRLTVMVHRIVAIAWIGPCPDGCICLHGPNGLNDNSVSNLSWGTYSDNNGRDRRRDGTDRSKRVRRSDGIEYYNAYDAADQTGINRGNICEVCNGRRGHAGGYGWKYVE